MGCFGNGKGSGCCFDGGWWWIIILAVLFFIFCNDDCGCFSNIFEGCDWLVWLAILLLIIFISGDHGECCD